MSAQQRGSKRCYLYILCVLSLSRRRDYLTSKTSPLDLPLKGIPEEAKFAAYATGFSQVVLCHLDFAYFCTLLQYPGSLDHIDNEYVQLVLSSEQGKVCGNVLSILYYDEHFRLAAHSYIWSTAYRTEEPNLTTPMFNPVPKSWNINKRSDSYLLSSTC